MSAPLMPTLELPLTASEKKLVAILSDLGQPTRCPSCGLKGWLVRNRRGHVVLYDLSGYHGDSCPGVEHK